MSPTKTARAKPTVADLLTRKGWRLEDWAVASKVGLSTCYRARNGRTPSPVHLLAMANGGGWSVRDLCDAILQSKRARES